MNENEPQKLSAEESKAFVMLIKVCTHLADDYGDRE